MANRISNFANAYQTTLSSGVTDIDTTFPVTATTGGPASPAYLVFEPDSDTKREIVYADGTFDATNFRTTSTSNRHLTGSAASSGLSHDAGTVVAVVPVAQMFDDLHDRTSQHAHGGGTDGATLNLGLREIVTFTSSGTFTKADYPWLRAVRVRLVGGGGGGGGADATASNEVSGGSGAAAGGYAEKVIPVASLSTTETVTVGAAGVGVAGANGTDGTASSFGAHCSGNGGEWGAKETATSTGFSTGGNGGLGGTATGGDINIRGEHGTPRSFHAASLFFRSGQGGRGPFGGSGWGHIQITEGGVNGARAASGSSPHYGAGGGGAINIGTQATTKSGGDGSPGIVIVELYG